MRNIDTTLALYRFNQYGDYVMVVLCHLLNGLDIIKRHTYKPTHQRLKTSLRFTVASGGQGCQCAAMKGLIHHNNFRGFYTLLMAIQTCKLDRSLVSFTA